MSEGSGSIRTVQPLELQALIAKGRAQAIDVRLPFDYFGGRIPGSLNLPAGSIVNMVSRMPFEVPLVFVCNDGQESKKIARTAQTVGFVDVATLEGGIDAWFAASLPTETISDGVMPNPRGS